MSGCCQVLLGPLLQVGLRRLLACPASRFVAPAASISVVISFKKNGDAATNKKKMETRRRLGMSPHYNDAVGMVCLNVSPDAACRIRAKLNDGFETAYRYAHRANQLCLSANGEERYFVGFNTYPKMQGSRTVEGYNRQRKYTTTIHKSYINFLLQAIPEVKDVVQVVQSVLCDRADEGLELYCVDILRQSSTGDQGAMEALFDTHSDNEGNRRIVSHSVVVLLSETSSSMRMNGFDTYEYPRVGSGVLFMSNDEHMSIHASPSTMKIALFFVEHTPSHLWFCRGFDRVISESRVQEGCTCWTTLITDHKRIRCSNNTSGCLRIIEASPDATVRHRLCRNCASGVLPTFLACNSCGRRMHQECAVNERGHRIYGRRTVVDQNDDKLLCVACLGRRRQHER